MGGQLDRHRPPDRWGLVLSVENEKRREFHEVVRDRRRTQAVLTAEELESGVPLPGRSATPKEAESKDKIEYEVQLEGNSEAKANAKAKPKTRPQPSGNDNENSDLAGKRGREPKREPRPSLNKAKRWESLAQLEMEMGNDQGRRYDMQRQKQTTVGFDTYARD